MCPNANFGDTGTLTINGQTNTYTKRSRAQLDVMIATNQNNPQIALTCTSGITDMNELFKGQNTFNQDISHWDTSNVTNMNGMFWGAHLFNQDIGYWNVASVTDMHWMFAGAGDFNQPINSWSVGNVTNMSGMFTSAVNFNQPLNTWDVGSVTNMFAMFANAFDFNQPLNNWDVSQVTNMSGMFSNASLFNQPLNNWNTSNLTSTRSMFKEAYNFNQPLNNWDVSSVTDMSLMFASAHAFNQSLNSWNTSNLIKITNMFQHAINFNKPLNNWDTSGVEELNTMFSGASSFNQPLDNWDVSNVSNAQFGFTGMFKNASTFNQNLSSWEFPNGILLHFIDNSGIQAENYDLLINKLVELELNSGQLGAENIEYCNAFKRQELLNNGWIIIDNGVAGNCFLNFVSGTVTFDEINDGCQPNDTRVSNYFVNVNNGNTSASFSINEFGEYNIGLNTGDYTLSIINLDTYFTPIPSAHTLSLSGQDEILENIDFCITANQQIEDLSIDIFPLEDAIPGFETNYQVIVSNNGTQTVPVVDLTFEYDDSFQTYVSSTITPSGNTTNILTYEFSDLEPFMQEIFEITMLNAIPPILNGGEVLSFTV